MLYLKAKHKLKIKGHTFESRILGTSSDFRDKNNKIFVDLTFVFDLLVTNKTE